MEIIYMLLLIAIGIMLILARNSWAMLLAKNQMKVYQTFFPKKLVNESIEIEYGKKIIVGVGIAFILAGFVKLF